MIEYKDEINDICSLIHNGLIDFDKPRDTVSIPSQVSSEFITNKQQGDWAEDVIFNAINNCSKNIVAVKYGKSDDLVAGDPKFESFFESYQQELDTIGKRPDLLLFKKEDYLPDYGLDISTLSGEHMDSYIRKAVAGLEIRSSSFLFDKYNEETNKSINLATEEILRLRDDVICNYFDLLNQKRPEILTLLSQLDEVSVRSLSFKSPSWRASQRLHDLSELLSKIKSNLKKIQKKSTLSITPKMEDIKVVHKWIMTYNVPHFYVQVFFDKAYGISFKRVVELLSNPDLEDDKYTIGKDPKNQNKTTIKIPSVDGVCIAQKIEEPEHHSVRKELTKGRLLFYVGFNGGNAYLDKNNFDLLFGCTL